MAAKKAGNIFAQVYIKTAQVFVFLKSHGFNNFKCVIKILNDITCDSALQFNEKFSGLIECNYPAKILREDQQINPYF